MYLQEGQEPGKARMYQGGYDLHPAAQVWPLQLHCHRHKDEAMQKQRYDTSCTVMEHKENLPES